MILKGSLKYILTAFSRYNPVDQYDSWLLFSDTHFEYDLDIILASLAFTKITTHNFRSISSLCGAPYMNEFFRKSFIENYFYHYHYA
jgi:hypothetical protein